MADGEGATRPGAEGGLRSPDVAAGTKLPVVVVGAGAAGLVAHGVHELQEAAVLPEPDPGAPEYRANTSSGRLSRMFGGAWRRR